MNTPRQTRPSAIRFAILRWVLLVSTCLAGALPAISAPVTSADAQAISKLIEQGFAQHDPAVFSDSFDESTLVKRALDGFKVPDKESAEMAAGIRVGRDLANRIVKTTQDGGSYRLLRIETTPTGQIQPVFRLLSRESLNYHHLVLDKDAAGAVKIIDVEIFISGEPLSRTLRRLLVPALAEAHKGQADAAVDQLKQVGAMQRLAAGGDFKKALELWEQLPLALRDEKALMLTRMQYAQRVGPGKYADAVKDYERLFPADPVLDLMKIYTHSANKRFDDALAAVDRLDRAIKDPYLDLFRAQACASKRNAIMAEEYFGRLLKWDPTIERGWGGLLVLALQRKDFPRTVQLLNDREKAIGTPLTPEALEKTKEFAEFVKSAEYAKWKGGRKASK